MHTESHPLAGQTITVQNGIYTGQKFRLEDWWDLLEGKSWKDCQGNPACIIYATIAGLVGLPADDEVVYGKIGPYGHLIHVSDLEKIA